MIFKDVLSIDYTFSVIGMGLRSFAGRRFWTGFDEEEAVKTIEVAVDNGVNFFDVSPVYGFGAAEKLLGKTLKNINAREKVFIATKCGTIWDKDYRLKNDLSRETILNEIDKSLTRLKTDYIDIYECNWADPNTDIEETMETLVQLKKAGKIRYIGFSNYSGAQARDAMRVAKVNSMESLYNMVERNPKDYYETSLGFNIEKEIFPLCREEGMAFFPYSPLMEGLLAGGFRAKKLENYDLRIHNPRLSGEKLEAILDLTDKLEIFAEEIGHELNQIALNYLIQKDTVTSIPVGVSNTKQLLSNLKSTEFLLTNEELEQIDKYIREYCFFNGEIFQ